MNLVIEKERIVRELQDVREEWMIEAIQRLLGIFNEEAALIEKYSQFPTITREELIERALESEKDIQAGRFTLASDLLKEAVL